MADELTKALLNNHELPTPTKEWVGGDFTRHCPSLWCRATAGTHRGGCRYPVRTRGRCIWTQPPRRRRSRSPLPPPAAPDGQANLPAGDEPRMTDYNQHHQMLELVVDRDAAAVHALARLHIENGPTSSAIGALEDQLSEPWDGSVRTHC